jgi:hypothetical protein
MHRRNFSEQALLDAKKKQITPPGDLKKISATSN